MSKAVATNDDELRFQHELRMRRLHAPSDVSIRAGKLQESIGRLSSVITELAQQADRGCEASDERLIVLNADLYDALVEAEQLLYRNQKARAGEKL